MNNVQGAERQQLSKHTLRYRPISRVSLFATPTSIQTYYRILSSVLPENTLWERDVDKSNGINNGRIACVNPPRRRQRTKHTYNHVLPSSRKLMPHDFAAGEIRKNQVPSSTQGCEARDRERSLSPSLNIRQHVRHSSRHTAIGLHYREFRSCLAALFARSVALPHQCAIGLIEAHAFIRINTTSRFTGALINSVREGVLRSFARVLTVDTMPVNNNISNEVSWNIV